MERKYELLTDQTKEFHNGTVYRIQALKDINDYIKKGDIGLGKSYIAGIIANSDRVKTVYETDAHEKLDTIEADIIVVGNKYEHSFEEIESKIKGEHEIIYVDFSKKPIKI